MAATPPPGYTPPPTDLPQRGDRATFSNRVDAWVTWFSTVILTQLAAIVANAYANAVDAAASAAAALGYRNTALTYRDAAQAARDLAQTYRDAAQAARDLALQYRDAAAGSATTAAGTATALDKRYLGAKATAPTLDNQGAALTTGAMYFDTTFNRQRIWNGTTWIDGLYGTAGVTTLNGQSGVLNLKTINNASLIGTGDIITRTTAPVEVRTSNTQITGADRGKWLRLSGTFTQTFVSAATLTDGWTGFITNAGTGEITMPDVDGWGSTWKMYPGETRLFVSDGAALRTVIIETFRMFSQSSGTFTKAPGYRYFDVTLSGGGGGASGGGGGGSGSADPNVGGGGSGGSGGASGRTAPPLRARLKADVLPASVNFLLGAGGVGGAKGTGGAASILSGTGANGTPGGIGGAGGSSTFGSLATPSSYVIAPGGIAATVAGSIGRAGATNPAAGSQGATALGEDTTTATLWTGAVQYPVTVGSAGGSSPNAPARATDHGPAGNGGNGSTSAESPFSVLVPATPGAVAPPAAAASFGLPGTNAVAVASVGPGAGGLGGAGGSGSVGKGTSSANPGSSGKGGDGSVGGAGGEGFVEILGVM